MVILDTSFLFALFVKEDDFHEKASALAKEHENELFFCSFLVFQELMTLLMSRVGAVAASKIGCDILDETSAIQLFKIDEEYFESSWQLFQKLGSHQFSFVDVSLIILSREFDAEVLTFDEGLAKVLG